MFHIIKEKIEKLTQKTLDDYEGFTPDIFLSDKMSLDGYKVEGTVIHLPGHTAGSVGLLLNDGSLIAGDTFVNNKKPAAAPNAMDFRKLYSSIASLRGMGIRTVYPGHGNPFDFNDYKR